MKKSLISILVLGLALTGLSGCNNTKETTAPATEIATSEETEASSEATTEAATETTEAATESSSEASESTAEETSAAAEAGDVLTAGYYQGEDGYLELKEDGTGIMNVNGYDWAISWDDKEITDEADIIGNKAKYTYKDGHLSFGWEGGDGYYTYDYDFCPDGKPQA